MLLREFHLSRRQSQHQATAQVTTKCTGRGQIFRITSARRGYSAIVVGLYSPATPPPPQSRHDLLSARPQNDVAAAIILRHDYWRRAQRTFSSDASTRQREAIAQEGFAIYIIFVRAFARLVTSAFRARPS